MTAAAPATRRTPYPERWAMFGPDDRARIAGDEVTAAELDALLDSFTELDDEERTELAAHWYERLGAIRSRLDATVAHERRLREQRRLLFLQLLLLGEPQAQVATKAGVSATAVGTETGVTVKQR